MNRNTTILLATGNPHKLEEIQEMLADSGWQVRGFSGDEKSIEEPVEDQPTFAGNARLKAMYYAQKTGEVCLADDSGLVVDALDGQPGVISARYSGVTGDRSVVDAANNAKLVEALRDVPMEQRTARFVCTMVLSDGQRTLVQTTGTIEGQIVSEPRGENGFGYDPHFWLDDRSCTTAELSSEEKNAISHRGVAAKHLREALERIVK